VEKSSKFVTLTVLDHVHFLSLSLSLSLSLKATLLSCSERVTIVPDVTSGPGAAVTPLLQINEVGHFYC
jgi:hypothetical protein